MTRAALAIAVLAAACSNPDRDGGARPRPSHDTGVPVADAGRVVDQTANDGAAKMTQMTCDQARQAIEARRFVGWTGLPAGCSSDAMFGVPFSAPDWGERRLGSQPTPMRILELAGYYRPTVSVRDGEVVHFDGTNPELDGGWAPLAADLGEPEARLDTHFGTLPIAGGEWVYPARGIAVVLGKEAADVLHVIVFQPTDLAGYQARLRPDLEKKLRPKR